MNGSSLTYEYGWRLDFVIDTKLGYKNTRIYFGDTEIVADENGVYSLYFVKNGQIISESDKIEYRIKYENLRGGTQGANNKTIYTIDNLPLKLDNPIWAQGYRNGVWEIPPVTENTLRDIEVTALWSSPIVYNINYVDLRGGMYGANNKNTYTADDLKNIDRLTLDNPIWTAAYDSGKWEMSQVVDDFHLGNVTAIAKWSAPKLYSITYRNVRGGTFGANNKNTYTADDLKNKDRLTLDNPIWTAAYGSGKWELSQIVNDNHLGHITAKAVWSDPIPYRILYKNLRGGAMGSNNKISYTADDFVFSNNIYTLVLDNPIWNIAYRSGTWEMPLIDDYNIKDFTAKAVWSDPITFNIDYINLQEGKKGANNNDTYTADDFVMVNGMYVLVLDAPTWEKAYKKGKWNLEEEINDFNLGSVTATAEWSEICKYTLRFAPDSPKYYYSLEELEWGYRQAPTYTGFILERQFTYFDEIIFTHVPGKPGYIGEWLINNKVADRVSLHTGNDIKVTCRWKPITYTVYAYYIDESEWNPDFYPANHELKAFDTYTVSYNQLLNLYQQEFEGYYFHQWAVNIYDNSGLVTKFYNNIDYNPLQVYNFKDFAGSMVGIALLYMPDACVAEGTMITLADGSQKAVEELTGDEMLLAWNLRTGSFDIAPILFIDNEPAQLTEVIKLRFSNDTEVKVISEHGFWDFNLNKYVYLDKNASQYIGHWFNKQIIDENGEMTWTKVQLLGVEIAEEYTSAWSPVTYGHLCYYVNGMLSMPGGISGLFNIFEVDSETLKYDEASMQADIETYGLYTYEEFAELLPISEEVFDAFNAQYFKVAIGKGLISLEQIASLYSRYAEFLN